MRACFEETARRAEKETLSYEQYLLELAGRECESPQTMQSKHYFQRYAGFKQAIPPGLGNRAVAVLCRRRT